MGSEPTNKTNPYKTKHEKIFQQAIKRLKSDPEILEEERTNILDLVQHLLAKGVGKPRAVKYINHMLVISRNQKPLRQFDRKDVELLVSKINTSNYTAHTKHDYLIIIKKYFQWLLGFDEDMHEYPPQVRWIKTTLKKKRLLPEALLTGEELRKLVEATENQRDRALILTDYDGGFRIHELLGLKIVNITMDEHSAVALVEDGKTGPRRVRLTVSAPALKLWLSVHPLRDDPNAPLWVGVGTVGRNQQLSYDGARALLRRLAKKTGLKKRIYTHLFRLASMFEILGSTIFYYQ
jgi:integrase/recombinase XerD